MRDEYDFSQGKPSAQVPALARLQREAEGKERITIRIDADVLAWFRARVAGGGSYQALINDTLRAAMLNDDAPLTVARLREVLRAEVRSATGSSGSSPRLSSSLRLFEFARLERTHHFFGRRLHSGGLFISHDRTPPCALSFACPTGPSIRLLLLH